MKLGSSIVIIVLIVFGFLFKKHKLLFVLCLLSLLNDLFIIKLPGPKFPIWSLITILVLPEVIKFHISSVFVIPKKNIKFIFHEYFYLFFLGIIFGFVFPWESTNSMTVRLWNQEAGGRSFVSLVRLFCELGLMLYFYYLIVTRRITLKFFFNSFIILAIFTVAIAVMDFSLGFQIKNLLFEKRIILGRFTGFNGEPRVFGKICSYSLLLLLCLNYTKIVEIKNQFAIILIIASGILISLSASTLLATIVWFIVISLFNGRRIIITILIGFLGIIGYQFVKNSETYQANTARKIEAVEEGALSDRMYKEPEVFTHFEVFDRAALNFLYFNPNFLVCGTGPNLISIPASNYISPLNQKIYGDQIDSVPHTGAVNILARSGIIGIIFFLIFFFQLFRTTTILNDKFSKNLLIGSFVLFLIIQHQLFYAYVGLILGLIAIKEEEARQQIKK